MGVWIETYNTRLLPEPWHVTPCMGVWIETVLILTGHNNIKCHTLYGCVD